MIASTLAFVAFLFGAGNYVHETNVKAAEGCERVDVETYFSGWEHKVDVYECADGSIVRVNQ